MTAPLTKSDIDTARFRARINRSGRENPAAPDEDRMRRLPPGGGIVINILIGGAMWLVVCLILYFSFFRG